VKITEIFPIAGLPHFQGKQGIIKNEFTTVSTRVIGLGKGRVNDENYSR